MTARRVRIVTTVVVAVGLVATPVLWTPLAFANGESRAAVLTTWIVIPVLPLVGAWVARHRPANPVGWLLLAIGMAQTLGMLLGQVVAHGIDAGWNEATMGWLLWLNGLTFTFGPPLFPLVLLLFPDGHPPTPRWRPAVWIVLTGLALGTLGSLSPGPIPGEPNVTVDNPVGIPGLGFLSVVGQVGLALIAVSFLVAGASLVARWRRSVGIERLQLRWVAFTATVTSIIVIASLPMPDGSVVELLGLLLLLGAIPASVGVAVVRYRLYDLPIVINRSLVFGIATAVLLAVYAALTAITVRLLEWHDTASALTATAVVAVMFSPVRDRAQGFVDRRLFGARSDPYQALLRLGRDLQSNVATHRVLEVLTEQIREALRVPYAAIVLGDSPDDLPAQESGTPADTTVTVTLRHRGELVGHLLVSPRPPDADLPTPDREVLEAMAAQAGAAVQASRLQTLVQASTARRVAAVEEERRRIRRDLHDGLGPTLAGIGLGLENATRRVERSGDPETAQLLDRLHQETQTAIASVRGLVYGLRPPALDELGLEGALRTALGSTSASRVDVKVDGLGDGNQLPAAVEVAAYRIAMEAVTNATVHGRAHNCWVTVVNNGAVTVEVADDGSGLPDGWRAGVGVTSMRERTGELGGTLTLATREAGGTLVRATLPIPGLDPPQEPDRG